MIGQYSDERYNTPSVPEGTEKPVYDSEFETNPTVDETLEFDSHIIPEDEEEYNGPDLTVETMSKDVPTWKPIPAVEVMAKAEATEKPIYDSEIEANPIVPTWKPIPAVEVMAKTEASEKPAYDSEIETNSIVDETLKFDSQIMERADDEEYTGPDLDVEPMPQDVPTWKPIPAVEVMAKAEAIENPVQGMTAAASYLNMNPESTTNLLLREDSEHFRTRWNEIQQKFIDAPRDAVQEADALVSEVVDQITQMFATEHGTLEGQWKQGNDVSTEDLRKALQHYRSFFNRLVV